MAGNLRQRFSGSTEQCIDKGLVKGKRQIIGSTPVIGNISLSRLSGLVRKCRENVLKTVTKQDSQPAAKLGARELEDARQVKFVSSEEGLQKEIEAAGELLDKLTKSE